MADEDPLVNGQPLSSLRVVDLREELDRLGLSKSGNKKELADRLKDHLLNGSREEGSPTKAIPDAIGSPTKSPENSLVAAYKARQAAALNKATEEKERVRRQSEHESPVKEEIKEVKTPAKRGRKPKLHMEEEEETTPEKKEEVEVSEEKEEPQQSVEIIKEKEKEKSPVRSETPPAKSMEEERAQDEKRPAAANNNKKEEKMPRLKEKEVSKAKEENMVALEIPVVEQVQEQQEVDKEDRVELDYGEGEQEDNTEDETKAEIEKEESTPIKAEEEKNHVEAEKKTSPAKPVAKTRIEAPKEDVKKEAGHVRDKETEVMARNVSPARYPPSNILHIRGLMRPFTLPLLKAEICKKGGEIVDFWIDNIRSHCFVKMGSIEEATATREALHGLNWPASNPKTLSVQFDNEENMDRFKAGESPAPVSSSLSRTISNERESRDDKTDRRERPTPLAGRNGLRVTLETMVLDNNKKEEKERERREREGREKAREIEKKMQEREAKEKEERENRKRHRSETPPHSRHNEAKDSLRRRDSPERKERRRNGSETREKKEEPVVPVKTADEFFKKTVAQPSIYYLPLTEEQAAARAAKKRENHRR